MTVTHDNSNATLELTFLMSPPFPIPTLFGGADEHTLQRRSMTAIFSDEEKEEVSPPVVRPDRIPFFFSSIPLRLRGLLTPKSCLQLSEFSHYVDNASGREGEGEREKGFLVRPMMTFGWFDKNCFEDSQLRKQEGHRRARRGYRSSNTAGYFSTKVTTFQSRARDAKSFSRNSLPTVD